MAQDQAQWTALVQDASAKVKAARLLDADWPAGSLEDADAALDDALADTPAPPPDPPPPDPPSWHGPATGFYASVRYGNGVRQWGNLTIPSGTPRGVLVQVHGGGWMSGDPNVALNPETHPHAAAVTYDGLLCAAGPNPEGFYGLRQMASYAAQRWGVIVWEPAYAYSTGNPDVCLADVKAAIHWLFDQLAAWGALQLPVVYAGHSAGGQLGLRAALDPSMPAPVAWLGMAAAGLTVHRLADVQDAPGGFAPGGTGWIFQTAWGADANRWPAYAPDGYLQARAERFPLYIEQGTLNGHDDGSVNVRWASDFAGAAGRAGWPGEYREQAGVDHYAVRWDVSPQTRADMDAIWGG